MEKEELQNKEDPNLKDKNLEQSTDKQAPEETEKKDEEEKLSPEAGVEKTAILIWQYPKYIKSYRR